MRLQCEKNNANKLDGMLAGFFLDKLFCIKGNILKCDVNLFKVYAAFYIGKFSLLVLLCLTLTFSKNLVSPM